MKAHPEEQLNIQALVFPTLLPSLSSNAGTWCTYNPVAEINAAPAFTQIADEVPPTNTYAAVEEERRKDYSEVSSFPHLYACCIIHNTLTSGPKILLCKLIVTIKSSLSINKL